jgi:hypothetical protein
MTPDPSPLFLNRFDSVGFESVCFQNDSEVDHSMWFTVACVGAYWERAREPSLKLKNGEKCESWA